MAPAKAFARHHRRPPVTTVSRHERPRLLTQKPHVLVPNYFQVYSIADANIVICGRMQLFCDHDWVNAGRTNGRTDGLPSPLETRKLLSAYLHGHASRNEVAASQVIEF